MPSKKKSSTSPKKGFDILTLAAIDEDLKVQKKKVEVVKERPKGFGLLKDNDSLTKAIKKGDTDGIQKIMAKTLPSRRLEYLNARDKEGNSSIFHAVWHGHLQACDLLLEYGADPNHQNSRNFTALHLACEKQDKRIILSIIRSGAKVYRKNNAGQHGWDLVDKKHRATIENYCKRLSTTEKWAAKDISSFLTGDIQTMIEHAREGEDDKLLRCINVFPPFKRLDFVNSRDSDGKIALLDAVTQGQLHTAQVLLAMGCDPYVTDISNGNSALHLACQMGDRQMIKLLVKFKADPAAVNNDGRLCWKMADPAHAKSIESYVRKVVAKDSHTKVPRWPTKPDCEPQEGESDFVTALRLGHTKRILKLLDTVKAKDRIEFLNEKDEQGFTALFHTVIPGHVQAMVALLNRGANPKVFDNNFNTPIHWACLNGHFPVIEALIRYEADPFARNKDNLLPHQMAVSKKEQKYLHNYIVRCGAKLKWLRLSGLLPSQSRRLGAEVKEELVEADDPLMLAAEQGDVQTIRAMLEGLPMHLRADYVNRRDEFGQTPLFHTIRPGHAEAAELLLVYGASPNIQDQQQNTCLHIACGRGDRNIITSLVHHDADNEVRNSDGLFAHEMVDEQVQEAVRSLIQDLIDVRRKADEQRKTDPIYQKFLNKYNSVEEGGEDFSTTPNSTTKPEKKQKAKEQEEDGLFAHLMQQFEAEKEKDWIEDDDILLVASSEGDLSAVTLLLEDILPWKSVTYANRRNKEGFTALHFAVINNHTSVVAKLLEHGGDPNIITGTGMTALHFACQNHNEKVAKHLVSYYANTNIENKDGKICWQLCRGPNHQKRFGLLIKKWSESLAQTTAKDIKKVAEDEFEEIEHISPFESAYYEKVKTEPYLPQVTKENRTLKQSMSTPVLKAHLDQHETSPAFGHFANSALQGRRYHSKTGLLIHLNKHTRMSRAEKEKLRKKLTSPEPLTTVQFLKELQLNGENNSTAPQQDSSPKQLTNNQFVQGDSSSPNARALRSVSKMHRSQTQPTLGLNKSMPPPSFMDHDKFPFPESTHDHNADYGHGGNSFAPVPRSLSHAYSVPSLQGGKGRLSRAVAKEEERKIASKRAQLTELGLVSVQKGGRNTAMVKKNNLSIETKKFFRSINLSQEKTMPTPNKVPHFVDQRTQITRLINSTPPEHSISLYPKQRYTADILNNPIVMVNAAVNQQAALQQAQQAQREQMRSREKAERVESQARYERPELVVRDRPESGKKERSEMYSFSLDDAKAITERPQTGRPQTSGSVVVDTSLSTSRSRPGTRGSDVAFGTGKASGGHKSHVEDRPGTITPKHHMVVGKGDRLWDPESTSQLLEGTKLNTVSGNAPYSGGLSGRYGHIQSSRSMNGDGGRPYSRGSNLGVDGEAPSAAAEPLAPGFARYIKPTPEGGLSFKQLTTMQATDSGNPEEPENAKEFKAAELAAAAETSEQPEEEA